MPVQVYYNNNLIGEPFISKSLAPMDYGNRWCMTETITLNGYIDATDGVQEESKQDQFGNWFDENPTGEVHGITDLFKVNFKTFEVWDDGTELEEFHIESCLIDEISFDKELIDKIFKFASIKHILSNHKNDNQKALELLEEIIRDLKNYELEFRIEELESKFSKDLSESTFNKIRELKKLQKIN